jgi:hypothetical protein
MDVAAEPGSMSSADAEDTNPRTSTLQRDDSNAIYREGAVSRGRIKPIGNELRITGEDSPGEGPNGAASE